MISLLATRSLAEPQKPHPHPAAPQAVIDDFKHFQDVFKSGPHFNPDKLESQAQSNARQETGMGKQAPGGTGGSGGEVFEDIHDLPPRFWKKPSAEMGQAEMDAIMVSLQLHSSHAIGFEN